MASPQSELFARTPGSGRALSITPGSRILQSPGAVSDEAIWKRFKEAGFDEESIKRRDKAALITYIAKLEAEIFNHQHHMGLLILERKELASNSEQIKASAKTAELLHKHDKAADLSALADARKREECLKKTVGVKEECIASIEKAMHELRAESAETKVAADSKLAEARKMVEDAQKKFTDAEGKLHAAESLQAEACRFHRIAERKMREVEAREDDLRRNILSFKMDCETKEKEISLDRQSLNERQKSLQQEQDRLLDAQALLNQREDFIFGQSQELNRLEKELEDVKANIEKERRALDEEKLNLELTGASLINREEALTRREVLLNKKEQEILSLQEKLMSKESDVIKKAIASHEADLRKKKSEFETELDVKRKSFEDKLEAKRRAWELREVDLNQREDLLCEREHDLEVQLRALMDREKEVAEMSNLVGEKEKNLREAEKEFEQNSGMLQIEREEIIKMKLELQRSLDSLEEKRKQLDCARERFELLKSETSELSDLEIKLKEEIDLIRAQKLELMEEADKLSIEKAKFESEWELIDEKREELRKEVECVAEERLAFSKFIKDEHDNLRREKDEMRDRHKRDVESLVSEREDFMSKMVHERTEWFSKMQKERADFLLEIEIRKGELENCIDKKHEELECSLKEKEIAFEQEKKNEVEIISSLKEEAAKERDQVALERKRLESERIEINLDRERRDREWAELCNSIEELRVQREKLKEQRELLHADREDILGLIQHLKELEHLKAALDSASVAEMQQSDLVPRSRKTSRRSWKQTSSVRDANVNLHNEVNTDNISNPSMLKIGLSPSSSARFSWLRRWRELMFKNSPEKHQLEFEESPVISLEKTSLTVTEQIETSSKYDGHRNMGNGNSPAFFSKRQCAFGEPKVIVEVPFVGDLSNGTKDSESEIKEFDGESCDPIVSEQVFRGGRKRRVDKSLSAGCFDPLLEPRQNVKKRRQQQDAVPNSSEHANNQCVASVPSHQIHEDAEEGTVSIVDKVTKVTKVIFGETLTGTLSSEDKSEAQNSVVEPDHVKNGVLPCDTKAQEKMQELNLGDAGQVIDHGQLQKQPPLTSHGAAAAAAASPIGGYTASSDTFVETSELADIDWDNLGFAFHSTDYMYVMKCAQGGNFPKGELQSFGNIELSPSAGVLNYGQGLFEGLKAYRKEDGTIHLFRPEENALRMRLGAERMCMPSPTVKQFVEAVKATVLANKRWVPPPGKGSLYIRPLLMGSGAVLGLAPAPEYTFLIYVSPVGNYFQEGVAPINLIVEHELHRATPGGTGGVKTIGNYAAVLKAQSAAKAKGYSDVLYLDCVHKKYLEEVSLCNIFVVKDNVISTPAIKGTILPGITRKSIIDVARSEGFQVEERQVAVDELLDADEVFCTGTAVVVSPVGSITYLGKKVSYGEGGFGVVSEKLYSLLTRLQMGLSEDKMDWTVELG